MGSTQSGWVSTRTLWFSLETKEKATRVLRQVCRRCADLLTSVHAPNLHLTFFFCLGKKRLKKFVES